MRRFKTAIQYIWKHSLLQPDFQRSATCLFIVRDFMSGPSIAQAAVLQKSDQSDLVTSETISIKGYFSF